MVSMEWINQAQHMVQGRAVVNTLMGVTIGQKVRKFLDYFIG